MIVCCCCPTPHHHPHLVVLVVLGESEHPHFALVRPYEGTGCEVVESFQPLTVGLAREESEQMLHHDQFLFGQNVEHIIEHIRAWQFHTEIGK